MRKSITTTLILSASFALVGCKSDDSASGLNSSSPASSSVASAQPSELQTTIDASAAQTWDAILATAESFDLSSGVEQFDGSRARLIAERPDDTDVRFYVVAMDDNTSAVKIRVGSFGNERVQNQLLASVKQYLSQANAGGYASVSDNE